MVLSLKIEELLSFCLYKADMSKFHFAVHVFLLKLVCMKYIWTHVRAREAFQAVKFILVCL